MKKIYLLLLFIAPVTFSFSQSPENALRFSWHPQSGTARSLSIGGAMGSLGGDGSALLVNPAGLAFYKTSEYIFSPGFYSLKNKSAFRETKTTSSKTNGMQWGSSGFISGGRGRLGKKSSGIIVTQIANFNSNNSYSGLNDYSSFAEPLADEFASSGLSITQAMNNNSISLQTKMALYTYLVDTLSISGIKRVIARSELVPLLHQNNQLSITGGITEITWGESVELTPKWLVGVSFGIPILQYNRNQNYREEDASGNINNNFSFFSYTEKVKVSGIGLNIKTGIIFRPKDRIRLGFAFHTPSFYTLSEKFQSGLATDVERLFAPASGYDSVSSSIFTGAETMKNSYSYATPSKILVSAAYVFQEVEDIGKQKGFISGDLEYTNYQWLRFSSIDNINFPDLYSLQNKIINAFYKGTLNIRIGGELKFKTLMTRAGVAYYGSPYKDSELQSHKITVSGGVGYRNKGFFLDATYVHQLTKDVNFPYRINPPKANTFAILKDNGGYFLLTVGLKR